MRRLSCSSTSSPACPPAACAAARHLACRQGWGSGCWSEVGCRLGFGCRTRVWVQVGVGVQVGVWVQDKGLDVGWIPGAGQGLGAGSGCWLGFGCRTRSGCRTGLWVQAAGSHVHDVGAVVEGTHVGLEDVPVEGGCQQAPVPSPLLPVAQQQPIPCGETHGSVRGAPVGAASPCPATPEHPLTQPGLEEAVEELILGSDEGCGRGEPGLVRGATRVALGPLRSLQGGWGSLGRGDPLSAPITTTGWGLG